MLVPILCVNYPLLEWDIYRTTTIWGPLRLVFHNKLTRRYCPRKQDIFIYKMVVFV